MANLITIGPDVESQPLNDNFAALNNNKLEKSGDTMTGKLNSAGSSGSIADSASNKGMIEVRSSSGTDAAFMTFHRVGVYASYLGIDVDNKWKVGGWSAGSSAREIWHEGNLPVETGNFTPFVFGSTTAGTLSYGPQTSGRYMKIQNRVFVECTVRTDGPAIVQPTGNLLIGGLPYVIRAETGNPRSPAFAISALIRIKLPTNGYMIVAYGEQGQSVIRLGAVVDNNEMAFVSADDQTFSSSWHIRLSGWYETN